MQFMSTVGEYLKRRVILKKYGNIVEAFYPSNQFRKLLGISVVFLYSTAGGRVETRFSLFGCASFVLWHSLYFYCTYRAHSEDQTILRTIYATKLNRYGDDFERISSIIFILYTMRKIPFCLSGDRAFMQEVVDLDTAIENMGEIVDYNKNALSALFILVVQICTYLVRMFCIWFTLENLKVTVPTEKLYQLVFTDAMSLILTTYYCFYLTVLTDRYKCINKVLSDIRTHTSWEYKLFVRRNISVDTRKADDLKERIICEKIKACARVYSMIYKATETLNRMFGVGLLLTILLYLIFIILYMFYFMEATATGLFHDLKKYFDFLVCVAWQMSHALLIIVVNIHFSESTMREARNTSFIIHDIMNNDFSASINAEAMQLSVQLLHQRPKFTANGLFDLDYALFSEVSNYDGARSVFTYLVILLQFATDTTS